MTLSSSDQIKPSSLSQRDVIINVDDLGLSASVNEAVIELAKLGRIRSTSYMAGGAITDAQRRALSDLDVDIGLHLDFTGIYHSTLKNSLPALIAASYLRRLDKSEVTDIIRRQLDGFEDRFNRPPVFVDGHQHVHQFPIVRACLASVLNDRYPHKENDTNLVGARITTPLVNDVKSWIIYVLGGHAWQQLCRQSGIHTNASFGGAYDFDADQDKLARLWETWLSRCPESNQALKDEAIKDEAIKDEAIKNVATGLDRPQHPLIMCHPAIPDNSWNDDIKDAREQEYEWLMSDAFATLCQKYQIKPVGWQE